ncbi:kinesin [Fusarium oxysporum f. sp. lycopersici 4287]|uniref:Kinesin n=1 Tax=Fusarium oxysporum f. sp. lycopersici (strain 4287 / CBS 123668 / FGSC 9935 / NRRL 34936) TaxID=426428 RepID=A0A0J9V4P9_FUSO4|nr:kinesin [Fusarium oxysporum f. sp. lycopersici 4287]KNB06504.1 kinesin [Fusarium oxysporum f. sp. lycopersici 4287]
MSRRLRREEYTVGWICALHVELAAAQEMLDEEHKDIERDDNDENLYSLGSIAGHNVVIVCLPSSQIGNNPAAAVATQMRATFKGIRFGLMVGIGGGVPSAEADIRLGDVVVSQPHQTSGGVIQYDLGKATPSGFERTGSLNSPPQILLGAVAKVRANELRGRSKFSEHLSKLECIPNFQRGKAGPDVLFEATEEVMVHYGTIASGNRVMKDGRTRDRLSSELGGILCFEMEAAGLMNRFPCLVVRGICDYADSHKNKTWQPYAAGTAAAYAKEVLSVIPAVEVAAARTVDEAIISEILQSAIHSLDLNQFLPMLSAVDQEKHISTIPPLDPNNMGFYWIFRNMDYVQWNDSCSQVLWLSGPPERDIHQASSYILGQEKNTALRTDHLVLYFFCSAASRRRSTAKDFVHTLLNHTLCCSPVDKGTLIMRSFLHRLFDEFMMGEVRKWKERGFSEKISSNENIQKLLDGPANELLTALGTVLGDEKQRSLSVIIDGLDRVRHQRGEFIHGIRTFVNRLQQRTSKVKILLTSQPLAEIKDLLNGLSCIEHDRGRKEHRGSFDWIWDHNQYSDWSKSDASRLLYIQGKPGSGKSTLTKYFGDHLLERELAAKSSIVATFFYSYREGELQRSHYSMLQSILYDILDQDEGFFYHRFQIEYRRQRRREPRVAWDYDSLKTVLKSLQDYPAKRLYLIIDAVDESEENDRRDILKLLFELCSKTKYCIAKVFVASRPVGELDLRISPSRLNFIRLQDETKRDISSFAHSFLDGLNLTHILAQAAEYIIENAQGVFLWVKLVGEQLVKSYGDGFSEEEIFGLLKQLPTQLEDFYKHMLEKMLEGKSDLVGDVKIFRFVLFAKRPLAVDELLHALGIPNNPDTQFTPSNDSFRKRIPSEQRIVSCGGNFLEIKGRHGNGTVQVMHQTVREFFLDSNGDVAHSKFQMCDRDAHICISMTCIRYLMLCAANATPVAALPHVGFWTSEHFERYAQYLDEWPLAKYALQYLTHHIDGCHQDAGVVRIRSRLIDKLTDKPVVYLLEKWVSSCLGRNILGKEQGAAAREFRNTLWHAAARNGFSTAVETLLTVGANVNTRENDGLPAGRTALQAAAEGGHVDTVAKLLVANADVNAEGAVKYGGQTALQAAAGGGHVEIVNKLLAANADVNAVGAVKYGGQTALQAAAGGGHVEIVDKLLAANAEVNAAPAANARTALQAAAGGGHVEIVDKLLAANADVNAAPAKHSGRAALQAAAGGGHVEIVDKLLAANAEVNAAPATDDGRTALQAAAGSGHVEIVDKLLAANADVNAEGAAVYGRTALQAAAGGGHFEIVAKLLVANADVNAAPAEYGGRTALQAAAGGGHMKIVDMLKQAIVGRFWARDGGIFREQNFIRRK